MESAAQFGRPAETGSHDLFESGRIATAASWSSVRPPAEGAAMHIRKETGWNGVLLFGTHTHARVHTQASWYPSF